MRFLKIYFFRAIFLHFSPCTETQIRQHSINLNIRIVYNTGMKILYSRSLSEVWNPQNHFNKSFQRIKKTKNNLRPLNVKIEYISYSIYSEQVCRSNSNLSKAVSPYSCLRVCNRSHLLRPTSPVHLYDVHRVFKLVKRCLQQCDIFSP